jgi:hypothetical protein
MSNYIKDADDVNTVIAEDKIYTQWEREEKNRILAMSNVQRKQSAWNKLFPKVEGSDDWLLDAKVF